MRVYGLSGKSGTGKSYNASELCRRMDIPALIDDGLFICNGSIEAGRSAKKERTKIGAVKAAIFTSDAHRDEVAAAIRREDPPSILVLGTSDEMVCRIAERLGLPLPEDIIHIEDITTPEQREIASKKRQEDGTHVIPAPTFQVKKRFSGYFVNPKKNFYQAGGRTSGIEKTIVRPTYSYLGSYEISEKVISDIVSIIMRYTDGISRVLWTSSDLSEEGVYVRTIVQAEKGAPVMTAALEAQRAIYRAVKKMTDFNVLGVEVELRGYRR